MGWTSVSYTVTRNNAVVQGLIDGKGYFFRIAAENIIGMGPFIETDKMVLIKDPICTSHLELLFLFDFVGFMTKNCHVFLVPVQIFYLKIPEPQFFCD